MEYAGGENLQHRLKARDNESRTLPSSQALSVISQCCGTVAFLHSQARIAHRDIKPANAIVSETSAAITIKFADFGFAKSVEQSSLCSSYHGGCGTVPYMAPEVVLELQYDASAADVWSTGMLLFDVACCMHFVEVTLLAELRNSRSNSKIKFMERIRSSFETSNSASEILSRNIRPEYSIFLDDWGLVLNNMTRVIPEDRWAAEDVVQYMVQSMVLSSEGSPSSNGIAATTLCSNGY
jgi:serine/threonine protein kinase